MGPGCLTKVSSKSRSCPYERSWPRSSEASPGCIVEGFPLPCAEALVGFEIDPKDMRVYRGDGDSEVVAVVDEVDGEDGPVEIRIDEVVETLFVRMPIAESPGKGGRERIRRLRVRRLSDSLVKPHRVDERLRRRRCPTARDDGLSRDGLVKVEVKVVARLEALRRPGEGAPLRRERRGLQSRHAVHSVVDVGADGWRVATSAGTRLEGDGRRPGRVGSHAPCEAASRE